MTPTKVFNLVLPFATYRELKYISRREEKPIAAIIRGALNSYLKKPNAAQAPQEG